MTGIAPVVRWVYSRYLGILQTCNHCRFAGSPSTYCTPSVPLVLACNWLTFLGSVRSTDFVVQISVNENPIFGSNGFDAGAVRKVQKMTYDSLWRSKSDFLSGFTPLALVSPETPTRQWGCCSYP